MKTVKLTDTEAHLISEVFEGTAYADSPTRKAVIQVASDCGILAEVGTDDIEKIYQSIWEKTK